MFPFGELVRFGGRHRVEPDDTQRAKPAAAQLDHRERRRHIDLDPDRAEPVGHDHGDTPYVGQIGPGLPGGIALPKYKLTSNVNYRKGGFSMFLQGRWIDGGKLDRLRVESTTNIPNSIEDNSVPSIFYTDLNVGYTLGQSDSLNLYFNATNLFDRAPVLAPGIIGRAGTTEFNTSIHDVVGRRYVVGFNYRF